MLAAAAEGQERQMPRAVAVLRCHPRPRYSCTLQPGIPHRHLRSRAAHAECVHTRTATATSHPPAGTQGPLRVSTRVCRRGRATGAGLPASLHVSVRCLVFIFFNHQIMYVQLNALSLGGHLSLPAVGPKVCRGF